MARASRTSVTLTTWADPPSIPPGFATSDHFIDIENRRSNKIYNVSIYSASCLKITQFVGQTGGQVTRQCDIVDFYAVIKSTGNKSNHHNVSSVAGHSGSTDQIETLAQFYDETQLHIAESLYTVYGITLG